MSAKHLRARAAAGLWREDTSVVAIVTALLLLTALPAGAASGSFSTFLQGNLSVAGLGHDAAGNLYLTGSINPSPIAGHTSDAVALRLDPAATEVSYFVYLGGSGPNTVRALAVDAQGNAYVTGYTGAGSFPATSGFSGPVPAGTAVPFVIKLNPSGDVVYSTLYAGAVQGLPQGIAVDSAGNAYVTGVAPEGYPATVGTVSANDPDPFQFLPFVTKLDTTGTKILFSAVGVGGNQIALGPQGDIFVAGNNASAAYPTTPGAFQTAFAPSQNCTTGPGIGFCFPADQQHITRLSADGTKLVYSTFLTGGAGATNSGLAVDGAGNAYVTGSASSGYPYTATSPADRPGFFLSKLDPTGSKVVWSVQQGGLAVALDPDGNVLVAGNYQKVPNQPRQVSPEAPPPLGNTPSACLPNAGTVQSIVFLQRFSGQDGSTAATQLIPASYATVSAFTEEPDGRAVVAGYTLFPDVPLTRGVAFAGAASDRHASGAFLAASDLAQASSGPQVVCVADSADFSLVGPVAPGQLISLCGSQLGPTPGVSSMPPAASIGKVEVMFDGTPAPLLYAGAGQVNVQVPFAVAQQSSTVMTLTLDGAPVASRVFAIAASNPSLFLDYTASPASCDLRLAGAVAFAAVALNADGSQNSCTNPAAPGSAVTVFLNGVAATLGGGFPASGSLTGPNPAPFGSQVDARAGTLSLASGPLYPAPGMISGIDQVTLQLPVVTLAPGIQEINLELSINGIAAAPFLAFGGLMYQQPAIVWVNGGK